MKRAVAVLLPVLFALAGCGPKNDGWWVPSEPQNALGRLAANAGYGISGIPAYEGARWTINVKVDGCDALVNLAGNKGAEAMSPTSFEVYRVDNEFFEIVRERPGVAVSAKDVRNIPAAKLKDLPGMHRILRCSHPA